MACEIVAEVATAHGGDIALAKEMIARCAEAGAHWVKFQSYQTKHLRPGDPQEAWLKQAELSDDAHYELKAACEAAGVKFLTTIFTMDRVQFLAGLGLSTIKIGSGECHERELTTACGEYWSTILVSYDPYYPYGLITHNTKLSLPRFMRCISRYPTPLAFARRVAVVGGYQNMAGGWCGWSDHCIGLEACEDAIMSGAQYIEKHVQFDNQKRPSQPWEMTLSELKQLRKFVDDGPERFIARWQYGL